MDRLLNFEAESLLNEDAFNSETEEESPLVRDHRTGQPGGGFRGGGGVRPSAPPVPRGVAGIRGGPGFLGRPVVVGRPLILGGPLFRGGPRFAGPRAFGAPLFRPGAAFRGGFPGAPGFRFRPRFGRFGFLRRPPFLPGMGFPGGFPGSGVPGQMGFGAGPAASQLVAWAQSCLAQMGDGTVPQNGILGPRTRRAIAAFQTEQQLAATGVLDNDTIAALQAACAPQDGGEQTGDGQ